MQGTQSGVDSKLYKTIVTIVDKRVKEIKATRKDFDRLSGEVHELREDFTELKGIVQELAEAQKRTEERVEELAETQKELAEAQKRTEERVEELAEAQKRTEERVEELAEAQKRTEERVEELAEAQKRTEHEIRELTKSHKKLQKEVGGISHTIGYHLEDRAYRTLPVLLKRDLEIKVEGRLVRRFFIYGKGKEDEVNIYGRGTKDGKDVTIIGESKSQLSKDDIDDFLKTVKRVTDYTERGDKENILIAVSYSIRPEVEEYAKEKGIKIYWSYELDL